LVLQTKVGNERILVDALAPKSIRFHTRQLRSMGNHFPDKKEVNL